MILNSNFERTYRYALLPCITKCYDSYMTKWIDRKFYCILCYGRLSHCLSPSTSHRKRIFIKVQHKFHMIFNYLLSQKINFYSTCIWYEYMHVYQIAYQVYNLDKFMHIGHLDRVLGIVSSSSVPKFWIDWSAVCALNWHLTLHADYCWVLRALATLQYLTFWRLFPPAAYKPTIFHKW